MTPWLQAVDGDTGEACEKTGWRIHAWVMMNNHYHLLLDTPEANLVAGMKWLQGTYTQRYNSRHEIFGHLFQGRYKAVVVEPEAGNYFAVVSTYVHLNPAQAGLIRVGEEGLARYRWSSYPWYVRAGEARLGWFVTKRVLGNLGLPREGRKGYEACIEGRVLELGIKRRWNGQKGNWPRRGMELGKGGFGVVVVPAQHGVAAVGERAIGDWGRIAGHAGHWAREARAADGAGAAEEATGAGL